MDKKPTHEQARLHLQVYDLRREARLREARDWFLKNYFVEKLDDAMRIAAPGTEGGAFAGMVMGYWEQACALLNYGLLHEDLFFETSGEFFGVWERLKPIVPEARERFVYKQFLAHMDKGREALRVMDGEPLARPCCGHATIHEADERGTCRRCESMSGLERAG